MKQYLVARYGQGIRIYNGYRPNQFRQPPPIRGATQGIIAFTWEGPFNAFGATATWTCIAAWSRETRRLSARTALANATSTSEP